jgi:ABC-type phosphate transport system substrate-binding protein
MKKLQSPLYRKVRCLCRAKTILIIAILLLSVIAKAQEATLVVVGNATGVPVDIKLAELKSILMGEKQRWKNGNRIIIALMKTNTLIGKNTSSRIYDMTGDQLNKYWLALVFQGKAQAPTFFNSTSELESFVAQTPGAIGIVDKAVTDGEVRSILVNGQKTF